jgi:hypothetical protein
MVSLATMSTIAALSPRCPGAAGVIHEDRRWPVSYGAACRIPDGIYEFFFTCAPLNKLGGVASPPNALAIK